MELERHIRARVHFENAPHRGVRWSARSSFAARGEYQSADNSCCRGRSNCERQFFTAVQRVRFDSSDRQRCHLALQRAAIELDPTLDKQDGLWRGLYAVEEYGWWLEPTRCRSQHL